MGIFCVYAAERTIRTIINWLNMGPGGPSKEGNRYNPPGSVALYLCDGRDGVLREVDSNVGEKVFLQEYTICPSALRLADCSSDNLTDFVKAVFDIAEMSGVKRRAGSSGYMFSQVIGQLVQEAAFEGMVVPGLRGGPNIQYRNVVMFDADGERWHPWSRKEAGFSYVITADINA
jgi:hypothetical protein